MKNSIKSKFKKFAVYALGFSALPLLTACYGVQPEKSDSINKDSLKKEDSLRKADSLNEAETIDKVADDEAKTAKETK